MQKTISYLIFFIFLSSTSLAGQDTLLASTYHPKPLLKLNKTPEALGISKDVQRRNAMLVNPPVNIALFGVDSRNSYFDGNADVIMIISIDPKTQKIKMSSILRDTYVHIEGKGMDKINASYAEGGPQLAIKTINQNFEMDIQDYLKVDFLNSARIVDALGGVTISVQSEELPFLNNYLKEISFAGDLIVPVKKPGLQTLTGRQAVAYARIRDAGRGDYDRTDRQKTVMVSLFSKMYGAGPDLLPAFLSEILPNVETSMSQMMLITMGSNILSSKSKIIDQGRFPLDSASKGERINDVWYLKTDLKATSASLYNFIYKDIKPGK